MGKRSPPPSFRSPGKRENLPARESKPANGAARPNRSWALLASPVFVSRVLLVGTLAVFSRVAWNEFVNYDDPDYVTSNPHVQSGLKGANILWAFKTGHASNWHPMTWISHMADCQFFGQNAAAHHLVNVVFHALNAVLLFLLLRKMTGSHWRSAFVAALFAWHPLHVESVVWASERKDVLSAFFFILTLSAYTEHVRRDERACNETPETRNPKSETSPKPESKI